MRQIGLWVAAALGLAGCDFTAPLAKTPEAAIDRALVGAWSRTEAGERVQRLLVLPLSTNEYLVAFPAAERDAMYARACLCRAADLTLAQLAWFGTGQGDLPDDGRVYQYAAYTVKGDTLSVGLLNADVVDRNAATPEALRQAIAANREHPELFREAMTFTREKAEAEAPRGAPKRPPLPPGWQ